MAGILRVYRSPGGWRPRLATLASWSNKSSHALSVPSRWGKFVATKSCQNATALFARYMW
jgi:hypothetical protein